MPVKYLNILALSAIVFLACSFFPTPVAAVSIDSGGLHARHAHIGQAFAKRAPRRCKGRAPGDPTTTPASTPSPANLIDTPAPTPTPAAPVPAAPSPNTGGSKAGLSFAYWDTSDRQQVFNQFKEACPRLSAVYNWSPTESVTSAALFVPMLPNMNVNNLADWTNKVMPNSMLYTHVLGFNEPERPEQANMDPYTAANAWRANIKELKKTNPGIKLVSPAVASSDSGAIWFADFISQCADCDIDEHAVHWYGTDVELFKAYLIKWHTTYGKPLWVTEFACYNFGDSTSCSPQQTTDFALAAKKFLEETDFIVHWFPFTAAFTMGVLEENRLLNNVTKIPTALAHTYFD